MKQWPLSPAVNNQTRGVELARRQGAERAESAERERESEREREREREREEKERKSVS